MADLATRHADALADVGTLEREQGAALLDGQPFDANLLAAKRGELSVIDAAEAEASRRARMEAAAALARQREEAAKQAEAELKIFIATIEAAGQLAKALTAGLTDIEASGARLTELRRVLGLHPVAALDANELRRSLGGIVSEAIRHGTGRGRYGNLSLPSAGMKPSAEILIRNVTGAFAPQAEGAEK